MKLQLSSKTFQRVPPTICEEESDVGKSFLSGGIPFVKCSPQGSSDCVQSIFPDILIIAVGKRKGVLV